MGFVTTILHQILVQAEGIKSLQHPALDRAQNDVFIEGEINRGSPNTAPKRQINRQMK